MLSKPLAWLALVLLLCSVCALADIATPTDLETPVPSLEPTDSPQVTPAPEATPTPAPTEEPGSTATPAPTDAPGSTATPAPTDAPGSTATPAPTDAPGSTEEPGETDEPGADDEPEAQPVLTLEITGNECKLENNVWLVHVDAQTPMLPLKRSDWPEAAAYELSALMMIEDEETTVWQGELPSAEGKWPLNAELVEQSFTVELDAVDAQGLVIASVRIKVKTTTQPVKKPDQPPQRPIRPNRTGGGMGGSTGITPGKALTTSHANGDRTMTDYRRVDIIWPQEAMTALTLADMPLALWLDDGEAAFTAAAEAGAMVLTPVADGDVWQVRGDVLTLLQISGVDTLTLMIGDEPITLSTAWQPQGAIYARLRSAGYVSGDFLWQIGTQGVQALVDGHSYILKDDKLTAKEE